ncbi:MAG: tetratricopeptide repeat protein [Planctomycetota bacterium]
MNFFRSRLGRSAAAFAVVLTLPSCQPSPEAYALDGTPLYRPELSSEVLAERAANLKQATAARRADPGDATNWIWEGRRKAYLGDYRGAIEIYTEAIERFPDEPRLYRHRGHRWITLRDFDRAIEDLSHAVTLIEGAEDVVEPDGLPNARGVPTSTLHTNVHYHLGLAEFLVGDYEAAVVEYKQCLEASKNPDMVCATTQWLYVTLRRLGRHHEAMELLAPITQDMDIIENHAYHRLLLAARGLLSVDDLLAEVHQSVASGEGVQNATLAFGVANLLSFAGREDESTEVYESIVAGDAWGAFGHIAAEVELPH